MVVVLAVAAGLVGVLTATAAAQPTCTDTWTGGGMPGQWEDGNNWLTSSDTTTVPTASDVACFPGVTVTVAASGDTADSIQGGDLVIAAGGSLALTSPSNPSTLTGLSIDGTGSLSAPSGQTLGISGAFTWGGTTAGAATLATTSLLTAGSVAINNGTSTPTFSGGSISSGAVTVAGSNFSGSGSPTLTSSSTITFQNAGADLAGSGTTFSAASVNPASGGTSGVGSNALTLTGGSTTVTSGETLDSGSLALTAGTTMTVNVGGSITPSSTSISGGSSLTDDGTVSNSVSLTGSSSTLAGTGSVGGIANTSGTVSPGDPAPGTLSDTGNFSQGASGTLAIVIQGTSGTSYSQLSVTGAATLGGDLSVTDSGGFSPANGDTFTPVTYGSRASGSFTLTGPSHTIYGQTTGSTAVTLTANVAPPNCPAGSDVFTPTSGNSGDWVSGGSWSPAVPTAGSIACWATSTTVDVGSGDNVSADEVQGGALDVNGGSLTIASASDTSDLSSLTVTSGGALQINATVNSSSTSVSGASSALTVDGSVSSSVTLTSGGTLAGRGSVGGIANTSGTVSPGDPAPGTLMDTGNFSQGSSGTLAILIQGTAPSAYSQLQVSGSATLGGNLSVTDSGFSPANGDTFTPITYGSHTGSFTLSGPNAGTYTQSAGSGGVTLTAFVAPPNCPSGSDVFTPTSGTSGDWVSGGSWFPATPGSGSIACWATNVTVGVGSPDTVSVAEVQGGALGINGGTLTLASSSASNDSNLSALSIANGGALGGKGQTLTVAGNTTWGDSTSGTAVNQSSPNNALNIDVGGTLTIGAANGSETWGGGTITTTGPTSINNSLSNSGSPTLNANGGLTLNTANMPTSASPGTIHAIGLASTGVTSVLGPNLDLTSGTGNVAASSTLSVQNLTTAGGTTLSVSSGGTLNVNTGTISGAITGAGAFTAGFAMGPGTTKIDGSLSTGGVTAGAGILDVDPGATYNAGSSTTIGAGTLDFLNGGGRTGALSLTGAGGLGGISTATLSVTGNFTWTGSAAINAGPGNGLAIAQAGGTSFSITGSGAALDGGAITTADTMNISSSPSFKTMGTPTMTTSSNLVLGSSTTISSSGVATFTAAGLGAGPVSTPYNFASDNVKLTGGTTTLTSALNAGPLTISGGNLQDDGAIAASSTTLTGGTLSGTGSVAGTVTNTSGAVSPGDTPSPGVLTLAGGYSQGAGGTLAIEINGTTVATGFSQLAVNGSSTTLDGSLSLTDGGGFVPQPGESFKIIKSASKPAGTFTSLTGPGAALFLVQYDPLDVTLTVNPVPGNVVAPAISGTPSVGSTLTCSNGTWSATPTSFTYQWNRAGSPITGATSPTYVVAKADQGNSLTCTVTASNSFGTSQPATSASAAVPPAPTAPRNTAPPMITGKPTPGNTLTCSQGTWSGSPTAYTYQWNRNGSPIKGATSASYAVQIGDEAASLSCTVTASNAVGAGSPVASPAIVVATTPQSLSCAKPSGQLSGSKLGPITLGATLKRAGGTVHLTAAGAGIDNVCLYGGWGINVGYPTNKLLRTLSGHTRKQVKGKIVLAITSNPYYALQGAHPGMTLSSVGTRLKAGKGIQMGRTFWYIIPGRGSHGVLKVNGGIITEVGIANSRLTQGRRAQQRFLNSFSGA